MKQFNGTKGNWNYCHATYHYEPDSPNTRAYDIYAGTFEDLQKGTHTPICNIIPADHELGAKKQCYQPNTWVSLDEAKENAILFVDAGNTIQKCGLLPSELLEQRDELVLLIERAEKLLNETHKVGKSTTDLLQSINLTKHRLASKHK